MAVNEQGFYAAGLFVALIVLSAISLSWMSKRLILLFRSVFGPTLTMVLIESPALFLHEMSHLFVAVLFGHRIVDVSLKGMFRAGAGGHVTTQYNPRSLYQRMGLSVMAIAPFALPMGALMAVLIQVYGYPSPSQGGAWLHTLATRRPTGWEAPSIAIALYLHLVIAATLRLSREDWLVIAKGSPIWIGFIMLLAALNYPPALTTPWYWPPVLLLATGLLIAAVAKLFAVLMLSLLSLCRRMVILSFA